MLETEKSFKFLQESIPQWLQDVARVEEKVAAMQDGVTKVSMTAVKRKSDSIESIRPARLRNGKQAAPSHGAQTDPVGNRNLKTHSALSGRASGPSRYTPKQMVIVEYDGDMQKSFEVLVRAIGNGRNMLRKAKMEAKMNELAALASSSEDDEEVDDDDEELPAMPRNSYHPRMSAMRAASAARRSGRLGVTGASITPIELLDSTDKLLENAQGLCEKAAHLTLRDGDCRKEMDRVRKSFDDVFDTAKTEVVKCNERKLQELQELQECASQNTSDTSITSIEPACKPNLSSLDTVPPTCEPEPKVALLDAPPAAPKALIEVDDNDEEEEFVMPPIRLMSRVRVRT